MNKQWIVNYTAQEDIPFAREDGKEILHIMDGHQNEFKIEDSKEMKVGIAYSMPFELEQFGLFHVSMHILMLLQIQTKKVKPLLLSLPKLPIVACSLFSGPSYQVSKARLTSGCFKLSFHN